MDGSEMQVPVEEAGGEPKAACNPAKLPRKRLLAADFRWWTDEYRCAVACIAGIVTLSMVLWHFDGKPAPNIGPGLQLDMVVIAITTLVRIALGSIVESCLCQGAWIWFSKSHQARSRRRAKLEDFKLFDEASRGLLGSLSLLWRLRGLHLSCIGALIIIVTHGFETFSQQLFVYVQEPICNPWKHARRTNISVAGGADADFFVLNPLQYDLQNRTGSRQALICDFEIMIANKRADVARATGAHCTLWFCLQTFNVTVFDGRPSQALVSVWNETQFEAATSAHSDEHVFVNMPTLMNLPERSRYSISARALRALRSFMDSLVGGYFERSPGLASYSSDWIEAMWQASSDLSSWIDKITLIMTNEVREHGIVRDPNGMDYEGSASKLADYVHVQWYWVIYPGVFFLISLYYLLSTIIASARDGVIAWKRDSLPMLFSHVDSRILALGPEKMNLPKGLDDLGNIQVALTRNGQGYWTFEPQPTQRNQGTGWEDDFTALLGLF
ncbi:hypothetical protein PLICBS_004628 [Purpureocillium lilacinum]|nr:hypothetical protein PLICBS_004628 [Purpureocillium lilacinum]